MEKLILDKSIFQGLSARELELMRGAYHEIVVLPLLAEVLGDLDKNEGVKEVQKIAAKLRSAKVRSKSHIELGLDSLFGRLPEDDATSLHKHALVEFDGGLKKTVERWSLGVFIDEEGILASIWRRGTRSVSLERLEAIMEERGVSVPRKLTPQSLNQVVAQLLNDRISPVKLLDWTMDTLDASVGQKAMIWDRWQTVGHISIHRFAPYAFYLMRVHVALVCSVKTNLAKWSPTLLVDNQYLFYLPLCDIFVTSDKQQRELTRLLAINSVKTIDGAVFKKSLESIK